MTLLSPELLPTKSYPFSTLRYLLQQQGGGIQEGVMGAGDFLVAQRGAGANLSVDVAAGGVWVQGDDVARQGLYHLVNDATVNVAAVAGHATLPRLDQVIARIYDSSVVGVSDTPAIEYLQGTATSGATIDNRTGAAALPNGACRIADLLVPATAGSILTSYIRDRRPWARGAFAQIDRTAGADYAISSGSFVAIDSTNIQHRVECSGVPLEILFMATEQNNTAGAKNYSTLLVDGGSVDQEEFGLPSANIPGVLTYRRWYTPTPGSHLFAPCVAVSAGTATIKATGGDHIYFAVREDVRQASNNGTA